MSESVGNQFGDYQAVRELNQVGAATIHRARRKGAAEMAFAIKELRVPVFLSPEDGRRRVAAFLARAALQRRIREASKEKQSHWAPIYGQPAPLPEGAYYVSDLYQLSAAQLSVAQSRSVNSAELHAIVRQVTSGLQEIQGVGGRPHANLTPGNILIRGRGSSMEAFLADPLENDKAAEQMGVAADLGALGGVIHQLVLHAPAPSNIAAALPDKPQWQALGDNGPKWRELCGRLLGAGPAVTSLEQLATEVEQLRPRIHRAWKRAAVIAGMLLIVSIGGAWALHKARAYNEADWKWLCEDWKKENYSPDQIRKDFEAKCVWAGTDRIRPEDLAAIRRMVEQLEHLKSPGVIANKQDVSSMDVLEAEGPGAFNFKAGEPIADDVKAIRAFDAEFAQFSHDRKLPPPEDGKRVEQLTNLPLLLGWQARVAMALEDVQSLHRSFGNDTFVARLCRDIKAATNNGRYPEKFVQTAFPQLDELHETARQLLAVNGQGYAIDRILADTEIQGASDVKSWLRRAQAFKIIPDRREGVRKELLARLENLRESARKAGAIADDQKIQDECDKISNGLTAQPGKAPVQIDDDRLTSDIKRFSSEVDDFVNEVTRHFDLDSWIAGYETGANRNPANDLQPLNEFWVRSWNAHRKDLQSAPSRAAQIRPDADAIFDFIHRDVYLDLIPARKQPGGPLGLGRHFIDPADNSNLPLAQQDWEAAMDKAGWDYCSQLFRTACAQVIDDHANAIQVRAALKYPADEWRAWRDKVLASVAGARALEAAIRPPGGMLTPDRPLPGGPESLLTRYNQWHKDYLVWQNKLKEAAITLPPEPLHGFALADDIEHEKWASLEEALRLSTSDDAGVVLMAWNQVAARLIAPEPPAFNLEADLAAFNHLSKWVKQVKPPSRQNELTAALKTGVAIHWAEWNGRLARHDAPQQMPTSDLDPAQQFNAKLYALRAAVYAAKSDEDDAAISKGVAEITAAAKALRGSQAAMAGEFIRQLTDSISKPGAATLKKWGPEGLPGWSKQVQAKILSFSYKTLTIDFAPLIVDKSTIYLSTTEVSADLFFAVADVVPNAGLKNALNEIFKNSQDDTTSPRVYESNSAHQWSIDWITNPALGPANKPLIGLDALAPPLRANKPAPSRGDPMQFVSATLADSWSKGLHFRLPTVPEWNEAWAQELAQKGVGAARWNLRDESWDQQYAFYRQFANGGNLGALGNLNPRQWRFFDPTGETAKIYSSNLRGPAGAGAVPYNDGNLFLLPALPSPADRKSGVYGSTFYHLVGNAAEVVTIQGAPADKTHYAVIGGSAFTSPDIGIEKPWPLDGQEDQTWPDVGFRLAFTPPPTPLRDLVAAALDSKAAQFVPD